MGIFSHSSSGLVGLEPITQTPSVWQYYTMNGTPVTTDAHSHAITNPPPGMFGMWELTREPESQHQHSLNLFTRLSVLHCTEHALLRVVNDLHIADAFFLLILLDLDTF